MSVAPVFINRAIERCTWLLGYLQRHGQITSTIAKREYGIPRRTYARDIVRLRGAGFILIAENTCIRYGGFDSRHAEPVRERAS